MPNRLESLELQGLKTFATTTRLEFPGKITAIVGPNGSGKSNIADAIRWVLGEQSFSLLRAKKTEDMIFSGSQHRSRAGMASSTITFNNEDGWLPIDYSQVAITRQAYRDGQNEYILNGQKVRLKDISELLAQTGLSERNYTIIGQGLVDAALALKPDERRKLFEEAAGIGLYRTRKEESLRRLEQTRKNLDRILDILTEIKPRLRSLERQSARYQEYHQVQSDLKLLLREWYGYQWHQKQQDLRNVRNAYQDQETRLHTLRKKYLEAEQKVEKARSELQKYRQQLEVNHSQIAEKHQQLEQTTRALAIIDERQRSNEQQKSNLEIDISNLQEEITELEVQQTACDAEVAQRQVDFQAAAIEAEKLEQQLAEISKQKALIDEEIATARQQRVDLETEKVQHSVRIEELGNRADSLKKEREKIINALETLEEDANQAKYRLDHYEGTQKKILKEHFEQQTKINENAAQIEALKEESQATVAQRNEQEARRAKQATQLDLLKQAESALSGYSEGSKKLVEISRQGKLPKGIEPLSQHILVEERFEQAISAALGELTDLLVLPNESREVLIEYLEGKDNERVALVAIDDAHISPNQGNFVNEAGVIGFASSVVEVDTSFGALVDKLFGDILIVEDARTAQRILKRLGGHQKAVTLSGMVFQNNGVIISGQSPSGRRIGRTRQQSELHREIEQLDAEIERLATKQADITGKLERLYEEKSELTDKFEHIDQQKHENDQAIQNAQDVLTRVSEQQAWYAERMKSLDQQIDEIDALIKIAASEFDVLGDRISSAHEAERKLIEDSQQLPVFEIQQELNHWQTHLAIAKNALEAAQQRYKDSCDRRDAAKQRMMTYQSRFDDLIMKLSEIEEKKEQLKIDIDQIQEAISNIEQEKLAPLSSSNDETEKAVSALQKLEAHSHQQVIIAERQYTQLQLELSRRQDQLDHLVERIEDDFGLVNFTGEQKYDGPAPLPFEGNLVENLPHIQEVPESHEDDIKRLKNQLRRMGSINPEAQQEYLEVKDRYEFLTNQVADLEKASKDLQEVIDALDEMMEKDFLKTYKAVNLEFSAFFSRLFNGGEAKLVFSDEENPIEGGVDIEARLPGRRQQGLALLSGGERSLTAVALVFALLKVSPPPFCILDEVDAMLDESNVGRFIEELRELSKTIQVVIITHNRNTVQAADVIYGVTMGRDSTSQMISLKLEEVGDAYFA
jgi:chromosome segregation protein